MRHRCRLWGTGLQFIALIFCLIISPKALSSSVDDLFFDSLRNANLQITKFESCNLDGISGDNHGSVPVEWRPNGVGNYVQPAACTAATLENAIIAAPTSTLKRHAITTFFNVCEKRLGQFHHTNARAMAMFAGARYAYCNHPRVRRLNLKFDDGTKLGGIIAMQPADKNGVNQPRPLVIYKCGVFCEVEDSSTKLMVMHMFDQAPFNVIAVGNNTSANYAADNNHLALGGYDDGMQLLRIARIVRNSPLSKLTSSIHVVGMSLGGHASLMSSYLNEHNLDTMSAPYFSSALALCPVVDLKPSVDYLFADTVRGKVSREVLMRNVAKKKAESPLLSEFYEKLDQIPRTSMIPDMIAGYSSSYYSRQPQEWTLPPLDKHPINSVEALWDHNNFFKYFKTSLSTPTLVFSALTDWVVNPAPNAVKLHRFLNASNLKTELKTVLVPNGNHCAFAPVYGFDTISKLYSSYVMAHSPEMLARKHQVKAEIDGQKIFSGKLALKKDERYVRAVLELKAMQDTAKITVDIWGSDSFFDKRCLLLSVYDGRSSCLRQAEATIPLSDLGSWTKIPSTEAEAEQLTRWANANLRYVSADGIPMVGSNQTPSALLWPEY